MVVTWTLGLIIFTSLLGASESWVVRCLILRFQDVEDQSSGTALGVLRAKVLAWHRC